MRGKPGQIKVEGDEISGDGANFSSKHLEIRDGIVTRFPDKNTNSDYTNPLSNPGDIGLQFRLPPVEDWDFTLTSTIPILTDGEEHVLNLADLVPKGAYAVMLYVRLQDNAAGSEIKFRNAD